MGDLPAGAARPGGRHPARGTAAQPTPRQPGAAAPQLPVAARTEQFFARHLGTIFSMAHAGGLLPSGVNPWALFAPHGLPTRGYRRPSVVRVHERTVLPLGAVAQLAEAIANCGPDTGTGPRGARFRALVLVAAATGARPSELAGLRPDHFRGGDHPAITFTRSAGPVSPAVDTQGRSWAATANLKARDVGTVRTVELPRAVADAVQAHLRAGYAHPEHLFTGPEGGPLRWGALTETYWRPAVATVCGASTVPELRDLEPRWLRKCAITWMLRAGLSITEVAEAVGNSPTIVWDHYAGVVAGRSGMRTWTGWDDAWTWGVAETDVP